MLDDYGVVCLIWPYMVQLLDMKGLSVMIRAYTAEEGGDTRGK